MGWIMERLLKELEEIERIRLNLLYEIYICEKYDLDIEIKC